MKKTILLNEIKHRTPRILLMVIGLIGVQTNEFKMIMELVNVQPKTIKAISEFAGTFAAIIILFGIFSIMYTRIEEKKLGIMPEARKFKERFLVDLFIMISKITSSAFSATVSLFAISYLYKDYESLVVSALMISNILIIARELVCILLSPFDEQKRLRMTGIISAQSTLVKRMDN